MIDTTRLRPVGLPIVSVLLVRTPGEVLDVVVGSGGVRKMPAQGGTVRTRTDECLKNELVDEAIHPPSTVLEADDVVPVAICGRLHGATRNGPEPHPTTSNPCERSDLSILAHLVEPFPSDNLAPFDHVRTWAMMAAQAP